MKYKLSKDSSFKLNESTLESSVLENTILFNVNDGKYFKTNESGKLIIEMLSNQQTLMQIINNYKNFFSLSEDQASTEVYEFIIELIKKNLITVV